MRRSHAAGVLALICAFLLVAPAFADDVDTLTVEGKRYRLDGIDAPESDQVCLDRGGQAYACGQAASRALNRFIGERSLFCTDVGPDRRDSERRVGQCFVDGIDINHWLVENGWAVSFEPYAKGRFKSDEEAAKAAQAGLWDGCFVAPQDFRLWRKSAAVLQGASCPGDARGRLFPDEAAQPAGFAVKGHYTMRASRTRASITCRRAAASSARRPSAGSARKRTRSPRASARPTRADGGEIS